MNSSKLNLYAGTFLGAVFVLMTVGILGDAIFHTEEPEQEGFAIEVAEGSAPGGDDAEEGPAFEPVAPLMASADVAAGENSFKKCVACHSVEDGGANKAGPNLWNIVNRPVAAHPGFNYSSALTEFADGGTVWDYEHLNGFLWKPKTYVSGTAMGFAGLSKVEERADIIAYLRTLSGDPAPLPSPEAAAAEGEDQPAGDGATETAGDTAPDDAATPAETGSDAEAAPAEEAAAAEEPASTEEAAPAEEAASDAEAAPAEGAATADEPTATDEPASTEAAATTEEAPAADMAEAGGFAALVAAADIEAGKKEFRKCAACHSVEEGGANKVGPNLWNIVNDAIAAREGYNYSSALKEYAEGGAVWDYETLNAFIENPKGAVQGTKMTYAGIKDEEDRANIVAYLRSMSNDPAPLP